MNNESGLDPRGVAVLVQPHEPELKSGLIEIPQQVQERMATVDQRMRIIAIGANAWHDEPRRRAEIGEIVLVTKFAGYMVKGPKDGQIYRLVNDRDIFCAITEAA